VGESIPLFRYAFEPDKFVWNEFKQAMPGSKGDQGVII